jgi:hypothetical protein
MVLSFFDAGKLETEIPLNGAVAKVVANKPLALNSSGANALTIARMSG